MFVFTDKEQDIFVVTKHYLSVLIIFLFLKRSGISWDGMRFNRTDIFLTLSYSREWGRYSKISILLTVKKNNFLQHWHLVEPEKQKKELSRIVLWLALSARPILTFLNYIFNTFMELKILERVSFKRWQKIDRFCQQIIWATTSNFLKFFKSHRFQWDRCIDFFRDQPVNLLFWFVVTPCLHGIFIINY